PAPTLPRPTLCRLHRPPSLFFPNHTPPTALYTLSLHDALPICVHERRAAEVEHRPRHDAVRVDALELELLEPGLAAAAARAARRLEEHTSELQSLTNLVCRLLLEKKKTTAHRRGYRSARP